MSWKSAGKRISAREIIFFLVIMISGAAYVFYMWEDTRKHNRNEILQIARSIEAILPKEELKNLDLEPDKLKNKDFATLKRTLQEVISVNKDARFAYLYVERGGSLYFLVDSEPEDSPDYSPAGQEFTEAASIDYKPITEGEALVTQPVTDRWGSWVSVEVPVKDSTGQIIAAFGMDYNAREWERRIFKEVTESSFMVVILLILALVARHSYAKNFLLKKEISQREKAEKKFKQNEQTLFTLISNLPGMVYRCALDENYTMEFTSEACLRITGYHPNDFIANKTISFNDLIFPEYRQSIWDQWQRVMSDKSVFESEYPIKTASGEVKWIWERGRCIFNEQEEVQYLEGYIEDITEKKKIEIDLIYAKEKAEESERLKSAFLANISHEVRTPMNGILGFAELLKEPNLTPENQQEFISVIELNLHRMLNIINDLIEISKIEAGEMAVRIKTTNLNAMLRELHAKYTSKTDGKNILLNYHCSLTDEGSDIQTDSHKLKQILTNLIKNALKFTDEGSVSFGYKNLDNGIEFFVSDTGQGIQPDARDLIFEPFRQADIGSTRKYEGVGLGLTISKAYVEQLGGSIRVESEIGKGSTFVFLLPYQFSTSPSAYI